VKISDFSSIDFSSFNPYFLTDINRTWSENNAYKCHYCEKYHEDPLEYVDDKYICDDCLEEYYVEINGEYYSKTDQVA